MFMKVEDGFHNMDAKNLDELMRRFRTINVDHTHFETWQAKTSASSELAYSASQEYFRKRKDRRPFKNAWEFLMLRVWHDVLEKHSLGCDVNLSAPTAYASENDAVIMEYITAPNAMSLNQLKKGEQPGMPYHDLRVEAALVFHAGALCSIKEVESLLHCDFQIRHLLFAYTLPELYIIDVENSTQEGCGDGDMTKAENARFKARLEQHTQGRLGKNKDGQPHAFDDLFEQGYQIVDKKQALPDVIRHIEDEYGITVNLHDYHITLR